MNPIELTVYIVAMVLYLRYIIQNENFKPMPVTFGIWFVLDVIHVVTYKEFSEHWFVPTMMVANAFVIFAYSIYRSAKKDVVFEKFDMFCIAAACLILLFYFKSGDAEYANILIQIILVLGFLPMLYAMCTTDHNEPPLPWAIFAIGWSMTAIITYNSPHTMVELAYPIGQGVLGCSTVFIISFVKYMRTIKKKVLI